VAGVFGLSVLVTGRAAGARFPRDLGEERSPGRNKVIHRGNTTSPETTSRIKASKATASGIRAKTPARVRLHENGGRTSRRHRARVTASRLCGGDVLRGVVAPAGRLAELGNRFHDPKRRRTPGPAAGCNKPVGRCAEKAVEVVRNHVGGTGLRGWSLRGRRWLRSPGVDARRMCRRRGGGRVPGG